MDDLRICIIGAGNVGMLRYAHLITKTMHPITLLDKGDISKARLDIFNLLAPHDVGTSARRNPSNDLQSRVNVLDNCDEIPRLFNVYWICVDSDLTSGGCSPNVDAIIAKLCDVNDQPFTIICSTSLHVGASQAYVEQLPPHATFIYHPERYNSNHDLSTNLNKANYVGVDSTKLFNVSSVLTQLNIHIPLEHYAEYRTVELMKHAENVKRALDTVWQNTLADLCVAADVPYVDFHNFKCRIDATPAINPEPVVPSVGFGGTCLVNSVAALSHVIPDKNVNAASMLGFINVHRTSELTKHIQMKWLDKREANPGNVVNLILYGVTYKPNSGDLAHSTAMNIVYEILQWTEGVNVFVCDPNIPTATPHRLLYGRMVEAKEALEEDVLALRVLLVEHREFAQTGRYDRRCNIPFDLVLSGVRFNPN